MSTPRHYYKYTHEVQETFYPQPVRRFASTMDSSWLLVLALLSALLTFISSYFSKQKSQKNFPPGPKPWPVIGNINLIAINPRRSVESLSKKYGEIMLLKVGQLPVVVVSSPKMAKYFLKTNDAVFASRPSFAAGEHTGYGAKNTVWAPLRRLLDTGAQDLPLRGSQREENPNFRGCSCPGEAGLRVPPACLLREADPVEGASIEVCFVEHL